MKDDINWHNWVEPTNYWQNHYIFEKNWNIKSDWMKEKSEDIKDWIYKIYVDIKEENYLEKIIEKIENYIRWNNKIETYNKEILDFYYENILEIKDFISLTNYFNLLIEENLIETENNKNNTKLILFIDNCDELEDFEKKDINTLVSIRERDIIYYLWLKWEEKDYIFYTNMDNVVISSWHDYYISKINSILED